MLAFHSLIRHRSSNVSRLTWPVISWRIVLSGIALTIRLEAIIFFALLAVVLEVLIMSWALDTHPLVHVQGTHHLRHAIHVTRHASILERQLGTLAVIAITMLATLAHEFGHALALRQAGATEIEITIFGAGGTCKAQARDTTPLALLWYAAAGPLVTIGVVIAILGVRVALPWPYAVHAVLWLAAAIQAGTLALNVLPILSRSDGGHMLRALTALLGGGRAARRAVAIGLTVPVLTLLATLQGSRAAVEWWSVVTVLLVAIIARIAWSADRRAPTAVPRPFAVGRTIRLWTL